MRKWKVLLSFLLIITFFANPGFAAQSRYITVKINGQNFKVNETPVLVDGQAIKTEAPSYITNGTTFVHLRFIESYGAKVEWEASTKTAIISQGDKVIKMSIDKKDIYINGKKKTIDKEFVPRLVTFPRHKNLKHAYTMIPFRLISETLGYRVGYNEETRIPYINTSKGPEEKPEEDLAKLNQVVGIKKEWVNGKEALVIENTKKVSYNTMVLKNPSRIVIDIKDSLLDQKLSGSHNYEFSIVKKVRTAQFNPDNNYKPNDKIVRVVLDIKNGVEDPKVKIQVSGNKLIITPEDSIWSILNYSMENGDRVVSVCAKRDTDYDVGYNKDSKTATISLPLENIDLVEGKLSINDGLIQDIIVGKTRDRAEIRISFLRHIDYNILSKRVDSKIQVSFKRDDNLEPSDRLIVIDPGHGGHDPGTVQNGVREKDINLAISLKLNEYLKAKGYTTVMTREGDTYPNNYDRAKLANNLGADLYISIHANSVGNSSVEGVQVLYYPKDKAQVKKEQTIALAKIILEEILKGTGAQNKNIIPREGLIVTRETNMPAVLIETGFLTNPKERKLLQTEEYQILMAKSIVKGIERYFEIY